MDILKIGLAVLRDRRLLVLRKKGGRTFILPGGKPEPGEVDMQTLAREIREELGTQPTDVRDEGTFTADAADLPGRTVTVRLFVGGLADEPRIDGEIEEAAWIDIDGEPHVPIADSLSLQIIPHLRRTLDLEEFAEQARPRARHAASLVGKRLPGHHVAARREALLILANHQEAVGRDDTAALMRTEGEANAGIEACVSAMIDYAMLLRDGAASPVVGGWPLEGSRS